MESQVNAEAYVSLEAANAYHTARPSREQWSALSDEQKAQRLLQASDYVDVAYTFTGKPTSAEQLRAFPRNGSQFVPNKVKQAVCELALFAELTGTPEPLKTAVKVGDLSVSYQQQAVANEVKNQRFPYVSALLSEFCATPSQLKMVALHRG